MKQNPVSFQLKLNPEDFLPATEEEKQSQVIMRESIPTLLTAHTRQGKYYSSKMYLRKKFLH